MNRPYLILFGFLLPTFVAAQDTKPKKYTGEFLQVPVPFAWIK